MRASPFNSPSDMNWFSSVSVRSMAMREVEVRAGAEIDVLGAVLDPVRDRDVARNSEIARDVQHPKTPAGFPQLIAQVVHVEIVELGEVHLRARHPVIPPKRIGIAFDQLQEALHNRFLDRVARRAAVRNRPGSPRSRDRQNKAGSWADV